VTNQQQKVYNFIAEFASANGFPPSVREIGTGVGLRSSSTVWSHLYALKRDGRVTWREGSPRTLQVVRDAE
jgi:repressor LexA